MITLPKKSNRADLQFAREMIKHHQAAVDMSRDLLKNGNHPAMLAMARNIIKAQVAEISRLRAFVAAEARHTH